MRETPGRLDALFRALGNRTRRQIFEVVGDAEYPVSEIAGKVGASPQNVSHHLELLCRAGLVTERREGSMRIIRRCPTALATLVQYLEQV
jgi:DNA-binding transcriptional ArsR family regulator